MKKFMMLATILVAGLLFIPNVYADYNGELGTVTENSGKDSVGDSDVSSVVKNGTSKDVVIEYNALDLKVIDANADEVNRGIDAAWVGFKITNPTSADSKKVRFGETGEYTNAEEDGLYYTAIKKETLETALNKGEKLIYKYYFDWNNDNTEDQTVTIIIDPTLVTLKAKGESDTIEFNGPVLEEARQQAIKEAEQQAQSKEEEKEENNPNTSDVNLYLLLSLIAVSGCGIAYTVKRRFN